jgi:hypothetical protein
LLMALGGQGVGGTVLQAEASVTAPRPPARTPRVCGAGGARRDQGPRPRGLRGAAPYS